MVHVVGQLIGLFKDGSLDRPAVLITDYYNWREPASGPSGGGAATALDGLAYPKKPRHGPPTNALYQGISSTPATPDRAGHAAAATSSSISSPTATATGKRKAGPGQWSTPSRQGFSPSDPTTPTFATPDSRSATATTALTEDSNDTSFKGYSPVDDDKDSEGEALED
jgi:hypothetical protein